MVARILHNCSANNMCDKIVGLGQTMLEQGLLRLAAQGSKARMGGMLHKFLHVLALQAGLGLMHTPSKLRQEKPSFAVTLPPVCHGCRSAR